MVFLGKKHTFREDELRALKTVGSNMLWISLTEMSDDTVQKEIAQYIQTHGKQLIVINTRKPPSDSLLSYLTKLELDGNMFMTTENLMEKHLHKCYIPVDNTDISFLDKLHPYSRTQVLQKRIIDYLASITLTLISFPIVLYSVYRIKKESPGPLLFTQKRIGKGGKAFTCYKFRSMHVDSHHDPYTRDNDSRIFPWGHFMRKARIDELPQIINVFKGDMHLIGPRAEWDILVEEYEKKIPFYHERHLVRPGITGNAQVRYPYGRTMEDTRQKLMFDFYYIKYWSLIKEFGIICETVRVVLGKKGI